MAKNYEVKLVRKEQIAQDTWLFALEKPKDYSFIPGQYQTVYLTLNNGQVDSRDMTIASSPNIKELWLVTKIEEKHKDFKDVLLKMSIGSSISIQGPSGGFAIREEEKPHVFLAGGIGITVFYSMLRNAKENDIKTPMTLLVSFSKKEDMLWFDELKNIENENRKIVYTLSQDDWGKEKGRISESLIKKYVNDTNKPIFMIAGGQEFVDDMNDLLLAIKVPLENIRIDYFTGY